MATADDCILTMADEENLSRIDYENVAIFFTTLSGQPVKIGKLRGPVAKPTTEEADQAAEEYKWSPWKGPEEGTYVRLSFEENLAIDARLNLSLTHVYKPAPSDRQKENGIDPDVTSQRRTLHLGKVNLKETPMYRKVIVSAGGPVEENSKDEPSFDTPVADESKADITVESESPLMKTVGPTNSILPRGFLAAMAAKFSIFFINSSNQSDIEHKMPTEQLTKQTKLIDNLNHEPNVAELPSIDGAAGLVRIQGRKNYTMGTSSSKFEISDKARDKAFEDRPKGKGEREKPRGGRPWRKVVAAVDRLLPPVSLEEVADRIDMDKDKLTALITKRNVWEVLLRFTPDGDYMTNWMTSQHDYGSQTEIVATTREIVKTDFTLRIYIVSVSDFDAVMDNWITAFVAHCRSNALYKWILPRKRFYVQVGLTVSSQSLPPKEDFACPARMAFKEWDEYCLIQGFLIIEAMEVASKSDCRIPAVALRLMQMPGARNKTQPTMTRAYFAAIHETDVSNEDEFASRLSGLTEGEKLGVCFDTREDSRDKDWSAFVVSTIGGNRDEYILALIRPFDKIKGKCADIPLELPEPIHLGEVKDRNDLRRKLISQDGFAVNIYRRDSITDYKRALRALDEITFNKDAIWDDRRKMLQMSNFGPEAPSIDFFATLSQAARNKIFIDLYIDCNLEQRAALRAMCAVPHGIFILPGCGGSGKTWLCINIIMKIVLQGVVEIEGEVKTVDMNTEKIHFTRNIHGKAPPRYRIHKWSTAANAVRRKVWSQKNIDR